MFAYEKQRTFNICCRASSKKDDSARQIADLIEQEISATAWLPRHQGRLGRARPSQLWHTGRDALRRDIQLFAKIDRWPYDMTHLLRPWRESIAFDIFLIQHQQSPIRQANYFSTWWQLFKCYGKGRILSYSRSILDEGPRSRIPRRCKPNLEFGLASQFSE